MSAIKGVYTKVYSGELIGVNVTNTSASEVLAQITIDPKYVTKKKILYVKIRDKAGARAGYFLGSDNYCFTDGVHTSNAQISIKSYGDGEYLMTVISRGVFATLDITHNRVVIYGRSDTMTDSRSGIIDGDFTVDIYTLDWPNDTSPYED